MSKSKDIQKKKTLSNTISKILFKVLIGIAIILFTYILIEKTDLSGDSMSFNSIKKNNNNASAPTDLKWYKDFRGIENVPDKKSSNPSKNSGFKYEGF